MHNKKSALAAAAALAVGLGSAGTAAANVYAGSELNIDDLVITISNGGTPSTEAEITNFNFTTTNTATLNGSSTIQGATCAGVPSPGSNTCNGSTPRLDAQPANAPGGTVTRTNNSFTFFGPGAADEFANSDSVIQAAQLTGDPATDTNQIAEAQLQTGASADANVEIKSTTGFLFTFDVTEPGNLVLSFNADPDLFALVNEANPGVFSAGSNITSAFSLTQNTGGTDRATWSPNGTLDGCSASVGVTCSAETDSQSLNTNVSTTVNGNAASSWDPNADNLTPFGIRIDGLAPGSWSLQLSALTSVAVTRNVAAVPAPGTLLLLGAGLAAVGFVSRRKKKA